MPVPELFHRYAALPQEHGAWYFAAAPLAVGLAVAPRLGPQHVDLVVAVFGAFLARHSLTLAVRVLSGRRPRASLPAALFWTAAWGLVAVVALADLVRRGSGAVAWLALPALPVLGWHLALVARRAERRQRLVEILAAGGLALGAPAALWISGGGPTLEAAALFGVVWLHLAGGILHAYLRLAQRNARREGAAPARRSARDALAVGFGAPLAVGAAALAGAVAPALPLAFVPQAFETLRYVVRPAPGDLPSSIGVRQVAVGVVGLALIAGLWS